jgi:hypothetical protein
MKHVMRSCVLEVITSIHSGEAHFLKITSLMVLFSEFQDRYEESTKVSFPVFFLLLYVIALYNLIWH